MAGVPAAPTLEKFYASAYRSVQVGLSGHARSMDIFSKANGVECAWEVGFSENFKTESGLSADFSCLRSLGDYAFTQNMVTATTASSLANRAEEMLNHPLLQEGQENAELEARAQTFKEYLIKNVINATLDDYGFKSEPAVNY